ncbi:MAG: peptide deformylase [Alphaproteobacteria bacterium]
MAILKIARMGHPILARPAARVADPTAPEVKALVRHMIETLEDVGGRGLAAPQVHVPLRVAIFLVPGENGAALTALVNPVIEPLGEAMEDGWEACLSVPGLRGVVPRHAVIRYRGTTPEGEPIDCVADGFHARVVQHECDHLDGVLYPQRMTDLTKLIFDSEMRWFAPAARDDADEDAA